MGVSQTVCPGWPWTTILLVSASQVTRIIGMSHWCPAPFFFFLLGDKSCCVAQTGLELMILPQLRSFLMLEFRYVLPHLASMFFTTGQHCGRLGLSDREFYAAELPTALMFAVLPTFPSTVIIGPWSTLRHPANPLDFSHSLPAHPSLHCRNLLSFW
jgi:hypothetical protein